ncbi:hypothetical protein RHGRI_033020 [Rhododendron griersonianum]|uniref:DNA repair RAD52-like protein 1, mitochondrial n=1 Tax=Rhododendron griersonianum TaxID=479676 RepID=A0AAV6HYD6_9ERIC|nr:hypothetical protein RHGRI_033020 [Rhododendron griersonianum]
MASFLRKVRCVSKTLGGGGGGSGTGSVSDSAAFRALFLMQTSSSRYSRLYAAKAASSKQGRAVANEVEVVVPAEDDDVVPTSGISRPLSEILKQLNKKVPDSLIRVRTEADGFTVKYIPWHLVNRILNLHAPEWSGEVRSISYSADGKSVSVVYRVTLYGTDAEIYRESTGTASVNEGTGYGDPVQKAEAMAFRRACARLGLGLHLYHEDML